LVTRTTGCHVAVITGVLVVTTGCHHWLPSLGVLVVTPGCHSIGYLEHTGCHHWLHQLNVLKYLCPTEPCEPVKVKVGAVSVPTANVAQHLEKLVDSQKAGVAHVDYP
jgi:hypothetical protein